MLDFLYFFQVSSSTRYFSLILDWLVCRMKLVSNTCNSYLRFVHKMGKKSRMSHWSGTSLDFISVGHLHEVSCILGFVNDLRLKTSEREVEDFKKSNINFFHDGSLLILDKIKKRVKHFLSDQSSKEMIMQ